MYKILIAEDEPIERKVLFKTLSKQLGEGFTILEAKNGREALAIFEAELPAIAILDIEMPGLSGLEVARRIRDSGNLCIILFLTAFDNFSYARQAIAVQALDYLLKPYDEQELLLAVESAVQMYSQLSRHKLFNRPRQASDSARKSEDTSSVRLSHVRERILSYIAANYTREISMQDVAQAMTYSDAYFCKLFKECFHVNFSAYLNEYRIGKAKAMLADSAMGIKDISTACGYSDSNYFSRVFKRITGLTPSEYRITYSSSETKQ